MEAERSDGGRWEWGSHSRMVGVSPKVQSRTCDQLRLRNVLSAAPGFPVPKEADGCWKGDPHPISMEHSVSLQKSWKFTALHLLNRYILSVYIC